MHTPRRESLLRSVRPVLRRRAAGALALALAVSLSVSLSGCATERAAPSGFLLDADQLQPAEDGSALVYRRPGFSFGAYDSVLMEPVQIFCASSSSFEDVSALDLKRLARSFEDAIQRALEDRYRFVSTNGPRTMRLRVAITNVEVARRPLLDAVDTLTGDVDFRLSEITMEGEVLDSRSGERQVAFVDRRRSDQASDQTAFDAWAARLRERMDAERESE